MRALVAPAVWAARGVGALLALTLVGVIRLYQLLISPLLGARCRFTPSCSSYALDSLRKYGFVKGSAKAAWRLLRCHPFCRGGHDPP